MSARETIGEKACRYLGEGRLEIELVSQGRVVATCQGEHGTYAVDYDPGAQKWSCSCPARKTCCHLIATQMVV